MEEIPESVSEGFSSAQLGGLALAWFNNPEVKDRLLDEKGDLIVPADGDRMVLASQACCVKNNMFLGAIAAQMRAAKTLRTPYVWQIEAVLAELWEFHFKAKLKAKRGGRYPKLDENFELSKEIQAACHDDAKALKSLLTAVRKQFMSTRVARDTFPN